MLESYFWAKGAEKFLIKSQKLTFNQRTSIVNTIVDFMIETFSIEVSSVQKTLVAAATIVLFPGLKFADGDGTVSIKHSQNDRVAIEVCIFYIFVGTVTW